MNDHQEDPSTLDEISRLREENRTLAEENLRLKSLLAAFSVKPASSLPSHQSESSISAVASRVSPPVSQVVSATSRQEKIDLFRSLFRGRQDVYALRWESKSGKSGYSPACANEWNRALCRKPCSKCQNPSYIPVSDEAIRDHVLGRHTVGLYPLLPDETCWLLAADFDKAGWQEDVLVFVGVCRELGLDAAVERSRSGQGGHVWMFFDEPLPAAIARKLGSAVLTRAMDRRHRMGLDSYDRFFPNQDTMPKGGFGNLIALPLQGRPGKSGNSLFLNDSFAPHPDQWQYLALLKRISRTHAEQITAEAARQGQVLGVRLSSTDDANGEDPWTLPPSRRLSDRPLQGPLPEVVNVVRGNLLYVEKEGLGPQLMNRLIRLAAFQNPEFYSAQSMRLPTFGKPRVVGCAEDFPKHIALPRGCLDDLESFLASAGIAVSIRDERHEGTPLALTFHGVLADEQETAVCEMLRCDNGVLVAPTGFGKTVMAARIITERKANTLILVHRKSLLDQWRERLASFLGMAARDVGVFCGERKKPGGSIDIALIQSLCRKGEINDLIAGYGHLIVDECHHIPAFTFEQVIRQAKAKYVLGLTATPIRKDGHHPIILMQCGPIRVRIRPQDTNQHRQCQRRVHVHKTQFALPPNAEEQPIQTLYAALGNDEARNRMILEDVRAVLAEGRAPLVLTERKEHLALLAAELHKDVRHVVVMHGGMGKKQRAALQEQRLSVPQDEQRVILATGRYAGEGFDDSRLDTLFLAMPIAWRGTLQQYVGRLHRTHAGKHDVCVYDYVDENVAVLDRMFSKRVKGYTAMDYELHWEDVGEEPIDTSYVLAEPLTNGEGTDTPARKPKVY